MNHVVKSVIRHVLSVSAAFGLLFASNAWASTIDTTVDTRPDGSNTGTAFDFTSSIPANLQISITGSTPAGGGSYPNNTQTITASSGVFEILGTGGPLLGIDFALLITVPTLPSFSFTLDPLNDGTNLITVDDTNFLTTSGDVSTSGNRPGNGSFNAFGPAAAFAFLDLGFIGTKASSGSGSFTPRALVGFDFGLGGPPVPFTFFAYGADGTDLEVMSANSESLTVLPGTPIPEPGTLLLIGSGLVGLGAGAWRRKKH